MYPQSTPQSPNYDRYPAGTEAAEKVFDLQDPIRFRLPQRPTEELPQPPQQPLDLPPPGGRTLELPPPGPPVR
jgi:hypothetical protein